MLRMEAVVMLALGAAAPPSHLVAAPPFRGGQCPSVAVSSAETPGERVRFSAASVVDLKFQLFPGGGPEGPHTLTFKVYTPSGHLYQELSVPFRAGWPARSRSPRGPRLTARLPVVGTAITTSEIFGGWRVEPHLDGSPRPCGSATRFQITR